MSLSEDVRYYGPTFSGCSCESENGTTHTININDIILLGGVSRERGGEGGGRERMKWLYVAQE